MSDKLNQHEVKALVRSAAVISYLQDVFYEKYPNGIPELQKIEELFNNEDEAAFQKSAELLVDECVSDLLWILEKYRVE